MHIPHIPSLFHRHLSIASSLSHLWLLCRNLTWGYHRSPRHSVLVPICVGCQYQFLPRRSLIVMNHIPSTGCQIHLLRQSPIRDEIHSPPIGLGPLAFAGSPWGWVVGRGVCEVLFQKRVQLAPCRNGDEVIGYREVYFKLMG